MFIFMAIDSPPVLLRFAAILAGVSGAAAGVVAAASSPAAAVSGLLGVSLFLCNASPPVSARGELLLFVVLSTVTSDDAPFLPENLDSTDLLPGAFMSEAESASCHGSMSCEAYPPPFCAPALV